MWLSLFTASSVERVQSFVTSYAHTGGRIGVASEITTRLEQAAAPLAGREVVGGFARSIIRDSIAAVSHTASLFELVSVYTHIMEVERMLKSRDPL